MSNYTVDRQRWAKMDILNQMGNIYSEVGRTVNAKKSGDEARFQSALSRALDLFDATVDVLNEQKSPRMREVLLAKYQFLSLFFAKTRAENPEMLDKYFLQFALAARLHR
jgi:broad specificity phosphatase PhoE